MDADERYRAHLNHLRQELTNTRLALSARNRELRAARSELRLMRRVMRLQNEASVAGANAALRATAVGAGIHGDV